MRRLSIRTAVVLGTLIATPLVAQQTQPTPQPPVVSQQTTPQPSRPAAVSVEPSLPPRAPGLPAVSANVKLDLMIVDTYTGAPTKKTVSMLILNGSNGMVRTSNILAGSKVGLNVDAAVMIHQGGLITVRLTFEYTPAQTLNAQSEAAEKQGLAQPTSRPAEIHESLTVLLQDGKPLLVSQSADPATDRKVTVEVTAAILK
jgi:hypothetical protein